MKLKGLTVLNTRPLSQAHLLNQLIKEEGGQVITLPMLEIEFTSAEKVNNDCDVAIFTSANATINLEKRKIFSPNILVVAIGKGTAAALKQKNLQPILPTAFNSEGLLALPCLQNVQR